MPRENSGAIMPMRHIASLAVLLALALSSAMAAAPVPRSSPEFMIVEGSGKAMSLSSLKGKVVLMEFMQIQCPHCRRVTQTINKLELELGPLGFQPIGIAFDTGITALMVNNFRQAFQLHYPIGYTTSDKVDDYLGRGVRDRFELPQLVVIDRAGVIRAQSLPVKEVNLEDETYLRNLINALLKEDAPAGKTE
jgi:peroxiredoxin